MELNSAFKHRIRNTPGQRLDVDYDDYLVYITISKDNKILYNARIGVWAYTLISTNIAVDIQINCYNGEVNQCIWAADVGKDFYRRDFNSQQEFMSAAAKLANCLYAFVNDLLRNKFDDRLLTGNEFKYFIQKVNLKSNRIKIADDNAYVYPVPIIKYDLYH